MKRTVFWEDRAKDDLRTIDRPIAIEILEAIDRWVTFKQGDVIQLRLPLTGFRLRVGDWRVFFKPLPEQHAIHVTSVLHRSKAYRQQ